MTRRLLAKFAASRTSQWLAMIAIAGLSAGLIGAVRYQPAPKADHIHGPQAAVVVESDATTEEAPVAEMTSPVASGELLRDAVASTKSTTTPKSFSQQVRSHTIWMQVTAYCPCKKCCGPAAQGLTASGRPISFNGGRFVAADTRIFRFNTKLVIPGYADQAPVQVIDRGGAIKGNHIDLFFPTHDQARQWGVKWMAVTVLD